MNAKLRIVDCKEHTLRLSPDEIRMAFERRKAVSLWDMTVILANFVRVEFYGYVHSLDSSQLLDEAAKAKVRTGLDEAKAFCDQMALPIAAGRIPIFQANGLADAACTGGIVQDEFIALMDAIEHELAERKLVFIPPNLVEFLEQDALFGDAVNKAFPSAQPEIKDAGNCLAADLPNAAIFHLMRVAELGLRALAKKVKAKLPVQVDFATWGQVIDATQKEVNKLTGKTPAKDKTAQFYSALLLDIRAFSYLWRNPVMHARSRYDEPQAHSAFNHVRSFMQRLAETVKETI